MSVVKEFRPDLKEGGDHVGFAIVSKDDPKYENFSVQTPEQKFNEEKNRLCKLAQDNGFEYAPIKDVVIQYPPRNSRAINTGNRLCSLAKADFLRLFPNGEFFDIFAVRDSAENDWIACITVERERLGFETVRKRLFSNNLCGTTSTEWVKLKEHLTTLFLNGETKGYVKDLSVSTALASP